MNGYDYLILGSLAFAIFGLAMDKFLDMYLMSREEMKKMEKETTKKILALPILILLLASVPGANATTTYHASIYFSSGATQNSSYDYLWITEENVSKAAWINITANVENKEIDIAESNVQNITLDAQKAMKEFGVSTSDVDHYLRILGEIKIVISGNGTNTYKIENLPEVVGVYLDGQKWNYSYSSGTLIFTSHMSTHTVTVHFKSLNDEVFSALNALPGIIATIIIVGVILNSIDDLLIAKFWGPIKEWFQLREKRR